jgi:uncharacterized membrane protein
MGNFIAWLGLADPDSRKRWISGVVTGILSMVINPVLVANGKQPIDPAIIISVIIMVLGWILQSGHNSATDTKAAATIEAAKIAAAGAPPEPRITPVVGP